MTVASFRVCMFRSSMFPAATPDGVLSIKVANYDSAPS